MSDKVACVVDCRNKLGEVPVWDEREQALWWVDIEGRLLQRYRPATGQVERWTMPERIGSFALREQGGLIVAFASGIAFYEPATGAMTGSLVIPSDAPPGVWYAYPVSFSDDVGNVTTVSFSGGALSQAVVGAGSAVMATAASFTVQGPPMYDLSGITPVDLGGGVIPDMAKPFPTRLSNVSVVADPTPPVAGMSAPKVTAVWEQGSVLP